MKKAPLARGTLCTAWKTLVFLLLGILLLRIWGDLAACHELLLAALGAAGVALCRTDDVYRHTAVVLAARLAGAMRLAQSTAFALLKLCDGQCMM